MLAGHGAELSTSCEDDVRQRRRDRCGEGRRRCGAADELDGRRAGLDDEAGREVVGDGGWARVRWRRDELDDRAGLGDGGEIKDGGGGGEDRRVDRKVEDT